MINALKYTVTFPSNGQAFAGEFTFQPGITAVTGKNGRGKSLGTREMIRYGLFGTKALRGPATDYKSLTMEMDFEIAGVAFHVERSSKKEELSTGDGEVKAVGAKEVNAEIVKLLGFGLDVFDVACASNQGESDRLTALRPTARKKLIDDVVGLTAQENIEKACKEEAKGHRREADTLADTIVVPTEPEKPKGYRPSEDLAIALSDATKRINDRYALNRIIEAVGTEPQAPKTPRGDVETLETHEAKRVQIEARLTQIDRQIESIPEATHTAAQITAAEALAEYDAELDRRGERPQAPLDYLDEMEAVWGKIAALKEIGETEVECPECEHSFCPSHALPDEPEFPLKAIARERRAHSLWETPLDEPKGVRLPKAVIIKAKQALDRSDERAALEKERLEIKPLPDRSQELRQARTTNTEWGVYEQDQVRWSERQRDAMAATMKLKTLPEPKKSVEDLEAAHVTAKVFETEQANYDTQKARYDEICRKVAGTQKKADDFAAGAKGLAEARRTLKAYLAPSLSRVASHLIAQMTNNMLCDVAVDDEMNIAVDDQDVATLSGSGKTVANLALRLALGQVLVNRMFPVFIGDEIDSDMDTERAQATADCLGNITDQLRQIILISHKRLEDVDHEIDLDVSA